MDRAASGGATHGGGGGGTVQPGSAGGSNSPAGPIGPVAPGDGGTRPPARTTVPEISERSFSPYFIRNAERGADPESTKSRTFDNPLRRTAPIARPTPARGPLDRDERVVRSASGGRGFSPVASGSVPARYGRGFYRDGERRARRADIPASPLARRAGVLRPSAGAGLDASPGRGAASVGPGGFSGSAGGAGAKTPTIEPSGSGFSRGPSAGGGGGGEEPRDPRVYYFGFSGHEHGWSFFYRFCQPLPVVNFAWGCCYDPLFSIYYWYPYYCHGGTYYYYDYADYCSPANDYYPYDPTYPDGEPVDLFGDEPVEESPLYASLSTTDRRPNAPGETLTDYFLRVGDQFFRSGDYEKAVDAFRKAVDIDPTSAVSHFALGEALFAVGDYAYAAYAIRKGFDLDASWTENPIDRRDFYGKREDFDAQLGKLLEHCGAAPFDAAAWLVLGYNRYFTADADGAAEAFGRVLELNGSDRFADAFLARLEAAGSPTAVANE